MRMKSFIVTLMAILAVLFILPAIYLMTLPPKDITPKDLKPFIEKSDPSLNSLYSGSNSHYNKNDISFRKLEFYVIVGSFRDPAQARQKAANLRQNNITDILILEPTPDGYTRISYGKYDTRAEAESVYLKVRQAINPQAWILTVEK